MKYDEDVSVCAEVMMMNLPISLFGECAALEL